jgi:DTW domain-containing protein YfiP
MKPDELRKIKRVLLIDSTWSQTKYYLRQDNIKKLKTIKIKTEQTVFWRYQKGEEDTSLSTIEALYFFFRDYESTLNHKGSYDDYYKSGGKWDNLMFYYAWNFHLI